jgi:hypothetical protein
MYAVVSKWEVDPQHVETVKASAEEMMSAIKGWDGVESAFNIQTSPTTVLAVITYRDQATYDSLINDPEGPFATAAARSEIEKYATWQWSERGEVV